MKKIREILWGLFFITIGILIGLNSLNIVDINIFFDGWWTLLIIVPCFIDLFKYGKKTVNIVFLIIGITLLLCCQGVFSFTIFFKLLIPILLIIIGLLFIFKKTKNKEDNEECCSIL